jgi:hypothetical protein
MAYNPDDVFCEIEIFRVVVEERREIGIVESGTARKAALKTVFVYVLSRLL